MRLRDDIYFYGSPGGLNPPDGVFNANTIVIDGPEALLIDPGLAGRWPVLREAMLDDGLAPDRITLVILTHGHPDHVEAGAILARDYGAALALHQLDLDYMHGPGRVLFRPDCPPPAPGLCRRLTEGPLDFGGRRFQVYLTPGHTPGGICLHWPERKVLLTGDLYFPGTIGAHDLVGGRAGDMYASVRRLENLDGVALVICGHDRPIVGRREVLANYGALKAEIAAKEAAGII
ncbi:MAG: MBL fold metallo-hydrolase [Candidatus Adiutrix sp.]|jgi:glyoxylase-like metal-dependent hydrolase (beta-lactamase superfamily II)|nr:MBL fold metallo-hydrolase [Candidatus Adiutrix sp.]